MAMIVRDEGFHSDDWTFAERSQDPFRKPPVFAECHAYEVLRRELRRYTANEVWGRSFLVSGHRGSGKTTLVLRAIQAARHEDNSGPIRRRPLLVKLHGPSLLMKVAKPTGQEAGQEPKPEPGKEAKGPPPDSGKTIKGLQPADGDGSAQAALVQITIALYRALMDEVVSCYRAFAIEQASDGGPTDLPELVGQLILELDNAPSPAVLRDFWSRVGALRQGVLWPEARSEEDQPWVRRRSRVPLLREVARLGRGYGDDQGIREVVAISTAAQAFQVVSGCVEYKTEEKTCVKTDAAQKAEAKPVVKDILYALVGWLTGGLVGGGTAMSGVGGEERMPLSVGLGLLTAVATSLTLGWTTTRTRDRLPEAGHTFIRDRSVGTLDRELLIVIERIRMAGLAPVFVVDELDKVDDLSDRMTELVERLKHIVADYCFFCFLTDREYFEGLHDRSEHEAYPKEYTYFSHRLFLLYRPDDFHKYLNELISIEPSRSPEEQEREEIGKLALSYLLLHRAMLHTFDLQRELAGVCDDKGRMIVTTGQLLSYLGYRYHIMIQLAIESLLGENELKDRLNQDPPFGQFVYDALYLPSRSWLNGAFELDLSDKAIEDYLCRRVEQTSKPASVPRHDGKPKPGQVPAAGADAGASGAGGKKGKPDAKSHEAGTAKESVPAITSLVREMDRQYLIGLVRRLVQLLAEPKTLVERLIQDKGDPKADTPEARRLAALVSTIPGVSEGSDLLLLQAVDGQAQRYRWCRDPFGRELVRDQRKQAQQAGREEVVPRQQEENDRFIGRVQKLLEDLGGEELSPDRLAGMGILRPSPDWHEVQAARQRLSEYRSGSRKPDKEGLHLNQVILDEYVNMLSARSRVLARVLTAGRLIGRKSGRAGPQEQTVHGVLALSKVIPFATLLDETEALERVADLVSRYKYKSLTHVSTLTRESIGKWIKSVTSAHNRVGNGPPDRDLRKCQARAWSTWSNGVEEFVRTGRSSSKPHLDEAVCIAADGPAALSLAKPVEHLPISEASTILWSAIANKGPEFLNDAPLCSAWPALHLLGMQHAIGPLSEMLADLGYHGDAEDANPARWLELGPATGEARRSALILSDRANGVTSQWLPSPSFGAVIASKQELEWVLRHEDLPRPLWRSVQSMAKFTVIFWDFENTDPEHIASVVPRIPPPLSELPYFILCREPPKQTPPPPWRVLTKTQNLDDAMKEALSSISA